MPGFTMTRQVHAPTDVVFDVFADIDHAPDRIDQIVKVERLTDGPIGLGTRWRETRVVFKKHATEELEITGFESGRSYTVGCESCGCEYACTFRFEPEGDGTRVDFEMEYRPVTFFAKLMTPLSVLMSGAMKKCMEKDIDQLTVAAESSGLATGAERGEQAMA